MKVWKSPHRAAKTACLVKPVNHFNTVTTDPNDLMDAASCGNDASALNVVSRSQLRGKGLVPQRLSKRLQRRPLPLVETRQALGFVFVHAGSVSEGTAFFS